MRYIFFIFLIIFSITSGRGDSSSELTLWADGEEMSVEYTLDAARQTTGNSLLQFYIRGSEAFEDMIRWKGEVPDKEVLTATLSPDFDTEEMGELYVSPSEIIIEYDKEEEVLKGSCKIIPIPGVYTLSVKYSGEGEIEGSEASIRIIAAPNIENIIPTFSTIPFQAPYLPYISGNAYYVNIRLNADPVDIDGSHREPTSLRLGSYYGYGAPYFKIYDSLSGVNNVRRVIDPALKEYVTPIPFEIISEAQSIKLEFEMNGAQSRYPETIIIYKDIVTDVAMSVEECCGETEYFDFQGRSVEEREVRKGIYLRKRGGKFEKVYKW